MMLPVPYTLTYCEIVQVKGIQQVQVEQASMGY